MNSIFYALEFECCFELPRIMCDGCAKTNNTAKHPVLYDSNTACTTPIYAACMFTTWECENTYTSYMQHARTAVVHHCGIKDLG